MREYTVRPLFQRATVMLLSSAFALTLAACGGGGGGDSSPSPSPLPSPPSVPPLAGGTPPVLTFGGTIGTVNRWPDGDTATGGTGQMVDGLPCGIAIETYHVHAHVSIFLNGDQLQVPGQIGIPKNADGSDKCLYVTHTHDRTGEIHVEAAATGTYTLGQVFDIWGQPLDTTNTKVADIVGLPIKIFIVNQGDTTATEYTDDPKKIELVSHRQITIQIGTAIASIPVYDFGGA